jgi:Bacterial SH3 domain
MSFARAAASAAVVILLSVVSVSAKPIATTGETNLRKGPGTDTEVLTLIPKGGVVEVGDCTNGWCAASFDGKDGYVIARNVGMAPRPAPRGRRMGAVQVYDEGPDYGPPPPAYYYRPYPYYGYPYYGWYRGWGWGRRYW